MNYRNAHHDPKYPGFGNHVIWFGDNTYCIGCFVSNIFVSILPVLLLTTLDFTGVDIGLSPSITAYSATTLLGLICFIGPINLLAERLGQVLRPVIIAISILLLFLVPVKYSLNFVILFALSIGLAIPQFGYHLMKIVMRKDLTHKSAKMAVRFLFLLSLFTSLIIWNYNLFWGIMTPIMLSLVFISLRGYAKGLEQFTLSDPISDLDFENFENFSCIGPLNACTKGGGKGGGCCGCNLTPCFALFGVAILLVVLFVVIGIGPRS